MPDHFVETTSIVDRFKEQDKRDFGTRPGISYQISQVMSKENRRDLLVVMAQLFHGQTALTDDMQREWLYTNTSHNATYNQTNKHNS